MSEPTKARAREAPARVWAVVLNDLRVLRRDPVFLVIWIVIPLLFMAFNKDAFAAALATEHGDHNLNGAEQIVPGATVLFGGFLVSSLGFSVFREHSWATWVRLRASQLSATELMVGKSVTPLASLITQLVVLLVGGAVLFGLEVRGSVVAFAAVAVALAIMEVALGFMLLAVCTSVVQLNAVTVAGAMLLGGLGGAFTPIEFLPGWAQAAAPATPPYWAMRGFRSVLLDGEGMDAALLPIAVLLTFALVFTLIAATRFKVDDDKADWT